MAEKKIEQREKKIEQLKYVRKWGTVSKWGLGTVLSIKSSEHLLIALMSVL